MIGGGGWKRGRRRRGGDWTGTVSMICIYISALYEGGEEGRKYPLTKDISVRAFPNLAS